MDWRHASELLAAGEAVYSELKNHRLAQDSCWHGQFLPLARIDIRVQERRRDARRQFSSWVNTDVTAQRLALRPASTVSARAAEASSPCIRPSSQSRSYCRDARLLAPG